MKPRIAFYGREPGSHFNADLSQYMSPSKAIWHLQFLTFLVIYVLLCKHEYAKGEKEREKQVELCSERNMLAKITEDRKVYSGRIVY